MQISQWLKKLSWQFFSSNTFFFFSTLSIALGTGSAVIGNWDWLILWISNAPAKTSAVIVFFGIMTVFLVVRTVVLTKHLEPKLDFFFDMNDPGCYRSVKFNGQIKNKYFRLKIETRGVGFVRSVGGTLLRIRKDGITLSDGDNLKLVMAPGYDNRTDHTKKDVYEGDPEYLDIITVLENNQIGIATEGFAISSNLDLQRLFLAHGKYEMDIVITAPDYPSQNVRLFFNWDGNWEGASMDSFSTKKD